MAPGVGVLPGGGGCHTAPASGALAGKIGKDREDREEASQEISGKSRFRYQGLPWWCVYTNENLFHSQPPENLQMLRPRFQLAPIALATVLVTTFLMPPAVHAQADAPRVDDQIKVSIAAQPLAQALNELARQAKLELIAAPELMTGRTAPAVSGTLTVRQALDRLLAGSGLTVDIEGANVFVKRVPEISHATPTLDAVTVAAQAERSAATEGTGSYTAASTNTATRLGLSLRETPQSVSVITRQRMDDQGLTQLSDVVTQTAGLSMNAAGNQGSDSSAIYSRGFAVENYQIDGVGQVFSGYNSLFQTNDMALYDRVEVVRGATGLMNGVGTPSATINLLRKRPADRFQASAKVEAGSWDYYRAEADISSPLNKSGSVRGRLVAALQDNRSYIDRLEERKKILYGVVDADVAPSTLLSAGFTLEQHDATGHARSGRPNLYADGTRVRWARSDSAAADWAYSRRHKLSIFGSVDHQFDNGWRLKGTLGRATVNYDELVGYASGGNPDRLTGKGVSLWATRWAGKPQQDSLDVYASGPFDLFGRRHDLVVGATVSRTVDDGYDVYTNWTFPGWSGAISDIFRWDGRQPLAPNNPPVGIGNRDERVKSAYATTRLRPTEALSVILGARVTDWENRQTNLNLASGSTTTNNRAENGKVTPYAGVVYDLDRNWSVYGSYTDIFKPQSNKDHDGEFLDPLLGSALELGLKGAFFEDRLNLSAAAYEIKQDNFAVVVPGVFAPDGSQAYEAVSGTKTRGMEFEASGEVAPGWQLSAGFARNIVQDRNGKSLNTQIPQNTFKLFTSYRLAHAGRGLVLGGGVRWQNRIYTDNLSPAKVRLAQDGYAVVDLMARYEISPQMSATVNLYNAFDQVYLATSTGTSYYGAPRSLRVGLDVRF
jgi:outer membrane receptor for ferric coprogen and ferric-rhodotorulic acid